MKLRKLTKDDVTIRLETLEEYTQVRGNVSCTDEPEKDKELEDSILVRIDHGEIWVWCTVKVTAKWNEIVCDTYLGCCSYDSEEDFKKDGYYTDMVQEAVDGLNMKLQSIFDVLSELVEP